MVNQELESIEALWKGGIEEALTVYRPAAALVEGGQGERVALAAALVEVALDLQQLGGEAPSPADLLRGDLCLARASRLLAQTRQQRLQVAFAVAIEDLAAGAAAGRPAQARPRLVAAIESGR